jgi:hypothetical protein
VIGFSTLLQLQKFASIPCKAPVDFSPCYQKPKCLMMMMSQLANEGINCCLEFYYYYYFCKFASQLAQKVKRIFYFTFKKIKEEI